MAVGASQYVGGARARGGVATFVRWSGVVALASCSFAGAALAQDAEVLFFESSFLPQSVEVARGGTVRFVWRRGVHRVVSGRPDGEPGTVDEPGLLFDQPLDEENPVYAYTFDVEATGGVAFFDAANPTQVGFVEIDSGERTFHVRVVDNLFLPDFLAIFAGDTVQWDHDPNEGFHTVTSGRSSAPEDRPGELFDEESSDAKPVFAYRFAEPGDYPYFCRPHESLGMVGEVLVQTLFVRGDFGGDGKVDIADAVAVLNYLFVGAEGSPCADAMDANDDGAINVVDPVYALNFLFAGGPPPPDPYPVIGADRSDDELRCLARGG